MMATTTTTRRMLPKSITEGANLGSEVSNTNFGPPVKLYEAVATAALLAGAALEGAGLALKEAVNEKKLTTSEARQIVGNIARQQADVLKSRTGLSSIQSGGQDTGSLPLDLPPGVQTATNAILYLASKTKKVVFDTADIVSKKTYEIGSTLLNDALDKVIPEDLLTKSYAEINPKFSSQVSQLAANLQAMATDPEARQAISNLAKATADVGIDAINAAMPDINRLVSRVWEVANRVGSKSIKSAMNVALAMLITALAEVPVVGGVVVGGLEAGTIFNNVVETGAKALQGFTQIAKDGMAATATVADSVGKSEAKLQAPIQQVKQVYNKFSDEQRMVPVQSAGALRSRRMKIERRLNKTLRGFFGKQSRRTRSLRR